MRLRNAGSFAALKPAHPRGACAGRIFLPARKKANRPQDQDDILFLEKQKELGKL